ncbi:hypothetical protein SeMB42_g07807 [Synchytrium endobioticum]|uniref:Pre-mRNA-splicing factor CWC24 n=1 Tax=Synchytrium endobioticum TaxID=286115 RepID=A0A507C0U2_9FUNG|nr:hypothetical protein SeMB42_g07807 [Synchytrium endobioticum]TPX39397.1 hypothetical protein SeLEV6574_g07240 [Synchytrium endobioticum]
MAAESRSAAVADEAPKVSFLRKAPANRNIRKRKALDEDDDAAATTSNERASTLVQKKTNAVLDKPALAGSTAAKRKTVTASHVFSTDASFAASGTAASLSADSATRTLDIDGAEDPDILAGEEAEAVDSGVYKGLNSYAEYVNKRVSKTTQANASSIRAGPLRGPTNVRISSRFDYQPDICKDYKETGYCGYGDSCIYMHDRGDYKAGWQLEAEWEAKQKAEKARREMAFEDDNSAEVSLDEDDELPIACFICRKEFRDPIVTKCKHYFCEPCAFKHHKTNPKCFICSAATGGLFTMIKADVKAKIAARRKRMLDRETEIREANKEMDEEIAAAERDD